MLTPGIRFGPYEIGAPIGRGGMGEVYRARDGRLDRDVALKVLPPALGGHSQSLQRFEREARAIAALNHPNICTIHDVGEAPDHGRIRFIVMELLEGETLRQRFEERSGGLLQLKADLMFDPIAIRSDARFASIVGRLGPSLRSRAASIEQRSGRGEAIAPPLYA